MKEKVMKNGELRKLNATSIQTNDIIMQQQLLQQRLECHLQ